MLLRSLDKIGEGVAARRQWYGFLHLLTDIVLLPFGTQAQTSGRHRSAALTCDLCVEDVLAIRIVGICRIDIGPI